MEYKISIDENISIVSENEYTEWYDNFTKNLIQISDSEIKTLNLASEDFETIDVLEEKIKGFTECD